MATDVSARRTIYVIADDDSLIHALAQHRQPAAGWRFAALSGPPEPDSLVILDLDDEARRSEAAARLRADGHAGPLLILGTIQAPLDEEDEPISRPTRLGLLLARVDAHASEPEWARSRRLGPYEFAPADRELRLESDSIRLTELECKLLACLAEGEGSVIGREELLARVWGYSSGVATHTVETHIWRLRQKIETDDPATRFLVTEAGGYRLAPTQPAESH
ncbi:MAG TPA: response regulator transcription factor [Alphaproteobacteria bacterium]|nr:response regulator transcription factor [Alphaproteobacteria bacterium]